MLLSLDLWLRQLNRHLHIELLSTFCEYLLKHMIMLLLPRTIKKSKRLSGSSLLLSKNISFSICLFSGLNYVIVLISICVITRIFIGCFFVLFSQLSDHIYSPSMLLLIENIMDLSCFNDWKTFRKLSSIWVSILLTFSQKNVCVYMLMGFPDESMVKNPAANAGDMDSIPELGTSLDKETTTHASVLAWKIPWTEESGGL